METTSDDENDLIDTDAEGFHQNEQSPVRLSVPDAVCRNNVANSEKCWNNLENSLSSSGEESEDEELDEFAKQLEIEVNQEESDVEKHVSYDDIDHSGCIGGEDFVAYADPRQPSIVDMDATEISTPSSDCETRFGNVGSEPHDEERESMEEANQEDCDVESLPDPERYASDDNTGVGEEGVVGNDDDAEADSEEERQQILASLVKAKAARVKRGDEPERKEVTAAGLSLDLQFSSIVTSYFATEEEKAKFEGIETSKKETKELARVQFEATQLGGMSMRHARRGGLIWCYKKQLKEFLDEMQESGEADIVRGSVEQDFVEKDGVWDRRNPGRGTKRRRFQHYKDFITLQVCASIHYNSY